MRCFASRCNVFFARSNLLMNTEIASPPKTVARKDMAQKVIYLQTLSLFSLIDLLHK